MSELNENTIKSNEHVFLSGMTQSGKSFLSEVYLSNYKEKRFILDTKGLYENKWIPANKQILIENITDIKAATEKFDFIIYRPAPEELNFDYYEIFFKWCYDLAKYSKIHNIVVVDEAMEVCPTPQKIPLSYKGILTRGMQLGVSVWSLTQRPATIPVVIYSEASHWFIFKLNSMHDREKLAEFSQYDEFLEPLPDRWFWYYNTRKNKPPIKGTIKLVKE